MNYKFYRRCASVLILLFLYFNNAFASSNITWHKTTKADQPIQIYTGIVAGSDYLALKGETKLNFSLQKIASVLIDVPHKTEWVKSLSKAKIIRTLSKSEYIEYNQMKAPWPVKDRDLVFKTTLSYHNNHHSLQIQMKSVTDPLMPLNKNYIRAEILNATFRLTALETNLTEFKAEIHADPKGSLPAWLVNIIQKKWPLQTIQGLTKQLEKDKNKLLAL